MKHYRKAGKIVFSLMLTTLILVVTLVTPSILLKLEDKTLYSTSHERKQLGGSLTDGSYLAWALHARNKSSGFFNKLETTEEDQMIILFALNTKLEDLVTAGVIPAEFQQGMELLMMNFGEKGKGEGERIVDEFGFERLNWYYFSKNNYDYLDISMQTESKTGKIVEFYISSNFWEKYISEEELRNSINVEKYVNWLGMGEWKDWEDVSSREEFAPPADIKAEYNMFENKDLQMNVYSIYDPHISYGFQVSAI